MHANTQTSLQVHQPLLSLSSYLPLSFPRPQLCLLPPLTSLTVTNTHWGHTLQTDQDRTAQTLSTKYIGATVSKLIPTFPVRGPLPSGGDAEYPERT